MSLLRNSTKLLGLTRVLNSVGVTVTGSTQTRSVKRWVAPTLRELRRRAQKLEQIQPTQPQPRSSFVDWNYRAELFAFGKRLNEEFQLPLLQAAFTQKSYILKEEHRQRELGIEETDIQMQDNQKLADQGQHLAEMYVQAFLFHSLPKLPAAGQKAFAQSLLNTEQLAYVANNLGMKELIFAADYPPTEEDLAQSLLAVIGALAESSGADRAFLFVRDFICTMLSQRDPLDLWNIANPEELLRNVCKERNLADPEPRLLGDCGKNTVLAAYQVGLYVNKELIGKGFGEDVNTAIKTASLDALQTMFGIQESMKPFSFELQVEPKTINLSPN